MRFLKLLDPDQGLSIEERQQRAHDQFPQLVAQSPFNYWRVGNDAPSADERILIGVGAAFHLPNLRLLDLVAGAMPTHKTQSLVIDVFDLEDIATQDNAEKYFPGLETISVSQLPVVGIWKNRNHVQNLVGHQATQFLIERFHLGITPNQLFESVHPPSKEMLEN
jgi:hypothetical protein